MVFSKSDIAKLRGLPIEQVATRLGLIVVRHRCLCPYHEDSNPSLSFLTSRNTFRCFACGAHGDAIDLVMRVLGCNFHDACLWLANEHNQLPMRHSAPPPVSVSFDASRYIRCFEHPYINAKASAFLFGERHLSPQVIQWCRLSSYMDTLQIPYYDRNFNLVGVQFRNLSDNGPRFCFPHGSQCHIYNLPILNTLHPGEELYVAEGCSDCWSLMSAGHKAIAIPSATLLKPDDLRPLSTLHSQLSTEFHMFPDQDQPGENLFRQLNAVIPITRHSLPSDCKDYSVYYINYLWR